MEVETLEATAGVCTFNIDDDELAIIKLEDEINKMYNEAAKKLFDVEKD